MSGAWTCLRGRIRSPSRGFTLIELMIVVAIMGLLAAVAIPNLLSLSYRGRRTEALQALHAFSIAQSAYFTENGVYADNFDDLAVTIESGTRVNATTIQGPYYTYTIMGRVMNGVANGNYRVTATGDIDPRDPVLDIVIIENQLTVVE